MLSAGEPCAATPVGKTPLATLGRGVRRALLTSGLRFSVIVPLEEHRGLAAESIAAWASRQTFPRGDYEVIVVSDGSQPRLEQMMERLLGQGDRLLREAGANRTRLYDLGARSAYGEFVFLTESHCLPDKDCLVELDLFFRQHSFDGCCCRSVGVALRFQDRLDLEMFDEGFDLFRRDGDWRKVNVHGFALRRRVYEEAGGLDDRYAGFAEMMLAAVLRDRGVRLGFAGAAVVQHHYGSTFAETQQLINFFVHGESTYRALHPGSDRVGYTFLPPGLASLPSSKASLWRSLALALARDWSATPIFFEALTRGLAPALTGRRWDLIEAVISRWSARWRYWWWMLHPARRRGAYRDWVKRASRVSRIAWLLRYADETEFPVGQTSLSACPRIGRQECPSVTLREARDLAEDDLLGFHAVETSEGRPFRWTGRAAVVRLALPAGAAEVFIETGHLRRQAPEAMNLRVYLDSRRVMGVTREGGLLRVPLAGLETDAGGIHTLALTCEPLRPWERGVPDCRELGLPIFTLGCAAAERAAA
jgi:hypothetical protein